VEVKKGLTLKTLVIGVILVALITGVTVNFGGQVYDTSYTTSFGHITGMTSFEGKGLYFPFWYSFGLFLWVAIVIAIINSFKPIFSRQEVACLAVMIIAAGWICGFRAYDTPFNNVLGIAPGAAAKGKAWVDARNFWSWVPDILGPKDVDWWRARVLPSAAGGSGVVDWGALMPTIVWFTLFLVGMVGTIGFTVLLLRRVYVDVEALQFPTMDMAGDVVEMTQPGSKATKFFTNPFFLIGFLVQAIWYLAVTVPYLLPLLRTSSATWDTTVGLIPGTTWYAWPVWRHEWISTSALPWVYMLVSLVPWQVGWGLMLSTEALIGVVGGWLVFWFIWPLASSAAGLLPTYTPRGLGYDVWYTLWRPNKTYNANLITVAIGFIVGLAVIPLWRNRSTLMPILKLWKEPAPEVDPARPIPYRMVWFGLIGCVVLTLAMGAVAQVMPLPLLVSLIVMTFVAVGLLRIYAETGGLWGVFDTMNYHPMPAALATALVMATLFKDVMWSHGADPTFSMAVTVAFLVPCLVSGGLYKIFHAGAITSMGSFKLGSMTRTDSKDVAKSVAIALGLGIAVATIMYYVWMHFVGVSTKWGYFKGADSAASWYASYSWLFAKGDAAGEWIGNIASVGGVPPPGVDYVVKFIIGFAVTIIVVFMRGRFTWFKISAAGIALGCMFGREIWSPFLVALVIKYLTTTLGGVKLYTEKLRPLSVGFIAGYCAMFAIVHPSIHLVSAFLNR